MRGPKGASAAILRYIRDGQATLLLSVALAMEYEAVCAKVEHRIAAGVTEHQVEEFVHAVIAMAEPVEPHFLWRPQLPGPHDGKVMEAAVNGRADALVTFNVKDYGDVPGRFGVDLLLPRIALGRLRQ